MNTENHTIQYLFDNLEISVRAYNVCLSNNIFSIDDLCLFVIQGGSFSDFRNCGRKTSEELCSIAKKYSKSIYDKQENNIYIDLYNTAINNLANKYGSESYSNSLCSLYDSAEQFVSALFSTNSIYVDSTNLTPKDIITIWDIAIEIISEMIKIAQSSLPYNIYSQLVDIQSTAISEYDYKKAEIKIIHFNEQQDILLRAKYQYHLTALSVRAYNILSTGNFDYKSILHFIFSDKSYYQKFRSCGQKTFNEIKDTFSTYVDYINTISGLDKSHLEELSIANMFPFLSSEEIVNVRYFNDNNGYFPMFYIALHYLLKSSDRNTKVFNAFKGIGCTVNRNIGEFYNITFERTRQICLHYHESLRKDPIFSTKNWIQYNLLNYDYLIITNSYFEYIKKNEFNNDIFFDINTLASIIEIVTNYYRIDYIDSSMFFSQRLTTSLNIQEVISDIKKTANARCKIDTIIPISSFIENYWNPQGLLDIKDITKCIKDICQTVFKIVVDEQYNCIFKQNTIDIKAEVYKIIELSGQPMHLEEIFIEFKKKFPDHKYTKPEQLRPSLIYSNKIKALGKTSTYAIDKWNFQTKSIRDLAYDILCNSSHPLKLEELVDILANRSRKTTINSLNTTIMLDTENRFVKFKGGYIGITQKKYDDKFIALTATDIQRFSFEERLIAFTSFIDTYHYSPQSGGTEEEQSLLRWYNNILRGVLAITKEQRILFDTEINKRKKYFFTGIEYNFMKKCDEFKLYMNNNYTMPNYVTEPQLSAWFNNNKNKFHNFKDKRKPLFKDLLNYLSDFGFSFEF